MTTPPVDGQAEPSVALGSQSPFSIENGSDSPDAPAVKGYAKLLELMPILARHQGQGSMNGLYFDNDSTERVIARDDIKITATECRQG